MSNRVRINRNIRGHLVVLGRFDNPNAPGDHTATYNVVCPDGVAAEIKVGYSSNGAGSFHRYSVRAKIGGKDVFWRESPGFGSRNRKAAIKQRNFHLAKAFDRVRAELQGDLAVSTAANKIEECAE